MTNMETERILFRPWRDDDAETLYRYASDPEVGPRAGWPPHKSVEESLEIIRTIFHSDHIWAIVLKNAGGDACVHSGEPIGCMGYMVHGESNINIGENDAEVGYWVARPYWNRGICSEALRLLIDYCFNVKGSRTLWADFFPDIRRFAKRQMTWFRRMERSGVPIRWIDGTLPLEEKAEIIVKAL